MLRLRCAQCGFRCRRVHDRRDKKVRDLEVSGRRTLLVWSRRRMVCDNCDSRFLEDHPAFEGALTGRLARRLVADAKVMTFSAAARRHGVHWHGVRAVVDVWSALVAERRRSRRCSVLLVDETSMRKRHRYVTVIVNGDTGRTLAMVEHRNAAALSAFLMQQGHRWCKQVKVVVSDGSRAYKAAIDAHLGHARHVAGPVPCHQMVRGRAHPGPPRHPAPPAPRRQARLRPRSVQSPVRAAETRRHPHRYRPAPASTSCSTPTPASEPGWQALQELHGLYTADDYDGALEALGRFCDLYQTGELPEYHGHSYWGCSVGGAGSDEILNWHCAGRPSNGRIEGTILWSVSEGVDDVADGHVAGCGGRVIWSVSLESAMLLAA